MSLLKKPKIYYLLLPLSWLYGGGVIFRNFCFNQRWFSSCLFDIPVICIGNITVGGTGKTPHTEYLIRLLSPLFQVAVLSRGYKRKSKGQVWASQNSTIEDIGDEPFQMWKKYPQIQMIVDRDRCHGIVAIEKRQDPQCEVVIMDDAFQHRYVKPGLCILLIDYNRPIFGDEILPAGRLREPASERKRADIIIVSKCPEYMARAEQEAWRSAISPSAHQQIYFTTFHYQSLRNLFHSNVERPLESLTADEHILLVTGIASPTGMIKKLSEYTPHVVAQTFADHHMFTENEIKKIQDEFQRLPSRRLIVTTDKDAVRLREHKAFPETLKPYIYILPVEVQFLNQGELLFNQNIIRYVRKNSRNSCLSQG